MHVIYKAPECPPEPRDIPNTLEELQATVGGYIETVTLAADTAIICNEEGRLLGLPYNCRFLGVDFVGPILVVGVAGDKTRYLRVTQRLWVCCCMAYRRCQRHDQYTSNPL